MRGKREFVRCSVEGCPRPHQGLGYCSMHYQRFKKNGDPGAADPLYAPEPYECSVEGCERQGKKRGWCSMHWERWRKHGDPLAVKEPAHWTRRNMTVNGYWRVWCPEHPAANSNGYALEHRKVWWDGHGPIPAGHEVHHLNHDKTDNRLENLELLTASEHHRRHIAEAGEVVNQFGTWPLKRTA